MVQHLDKFGHQAEIEEKSPFSKTNNADNITDFRKKTKK